MALHNEVLALVLGGGQGSRLFPLTQLRSKPAVPIAGKYRLIDIPISNCLHADIRRIFVLTQFNSASLNRHIGQTYRMDLFSQGFVEILAAEQTPDNSSWFQGTADAVRQAARHITRHEADYYVILAGDHLYRMDYSEIVEAHIDRQADITIAAQPVAPDEASGMGILRFDRDGQIVAFEEKPDAARLADIGRSIPAGASFGGHMPDKPFVASLGIYVFSREVLFEVLEQDEATDFGRGIIPHALNHYEVQAHLFRGYWADVGTIQSFYDANVMLTQPGAPFSFYDPRRPIYTRPRFLPGARLADCTVRDAIIAEGLRHRSLRDRAVRHRDPRQHPIRHAHHPLRAPRRGLLRVRRRGTRARQPAAARHRPRRGARSRDRGQERADWRPREPDQRGRCPGSQRHRLLHPQRDRHRAERRGDRRRDGGLM